MTAKFPGFFAVVAMMSFSMEAPSNAGEPPQTVALPDNMQVFEGAGADAVNRDCLGCHSVEMVLDQPDLSRTAWQSEVTKMIKMYKAPVASDDIRAIIDYLARTKGRN